MAGTASGGEPVRRGLAEKRLAIMEAARTVFGREGFTRASVDAIAAEAGVSKRTIYNHFTDKEQLFRTVMEESSQAVAAAHKEIIGRHFDALVAADPRSVDVAARLIAFGKEFAVPTKELAGHFGLVRNIVAEVLRLPAEVLEAWQEAGPRPVQRELTRRLAELSDRGLLRIEPGEEASAGNHFIQLVGAEITQASYYGALEVPPEVVEKSVSSGVRAFVRLYGAGAGS
jgi:AcrR family transcriptional regulator